MKKYLSIITILIYCWGVSQDDKFVPLNEDLFEWDAKITVKREKCGEGWMKIEKIKRNTPNKQGKIVSSGGDYTLVYMKCNKDKTIKNEDFLKYGENGELIFRENLSYLGYSRIVPETNADYACAYFLKKKQREKKDSTVEINHEKLYKQYLKDGGTVSYEDYLSIPHAFDVEKSLNDHNVKSNGMCD